jgi:hypothetical protein
MDRRLLDRLTAGVVKPTLAMLDGPTLDRPTGRNRVWLSMLPCEGLL